MTDRHKALVLGYGALSLCFLVIGAYMVYVVQPMPFGELLHMIAEYGFPLPVVMAGTFVFLTLALGSWKLPTLPRKYRALLLVLAWLLAAIQFVRFFRMSVIVANHDFSLSQLGWSAYIPQAILGVHLIAMAVLLVIEASRHNMALEPTAESLRALRAQASVGGGST